MKPGLEGVDQRAGLEQARPACIHDQRVGLHAPQVLARHDPPRDSVDDHDVDRVRVAADRSLFVSGAETPDDGVEAGLTFASALSREFHALSERTSVAFTTNIGVSTGAIAAGVLAQGSLTFAAWGEPVRRALAISALASHDEILVDGSAADAAGDRWTFEDADDVIDLLQAGPEGITWVRPGGPADRSGEVSEQILAHARKLRELGRAGNADGALDEASVQNLWLRQVQTTPAQFLKAKFSYQVAQKSQEPNPTGDAQ